MYLSTKYVSVDDGTDLFGESHQRKALTVAAPPDLLIADGARDTISADSFREITRYWKLEKPISKGSPLWLGFVTSDLLVSNEYGVFGQLPSTASDADLGRERKLLEGLCEGA